MRIALAQAAPLPLGKACGETLFILVRPWLVPQGGTIKTYFSNVFAGGVFARAGRGEARRGRTGGRASG